MSESGSALIVGVGGQGVLLASELLAAVALADGREVTKSDVHGMAQRGGVVFSHVRFGASVESPVIERGAADALLALEWAEALRWIAYVRPGGAVVADRARIVPPAACFDRQTFRSRYPDLDPALLQSLGRELYLVDGSGLAKSAGAARAANVVLLGCLSRKLDFAPELWAEVIRDRVPPHAIEANLRAFETGRAVPLAPEIPRVAPPEEAPFAPRRFHVAVTGSWCKGCDICVRVCPQNCLALDDQGIARAAREERCTGCLLCEVLCPDFAIAVRGEEVLAHG
jgi:indolepyruvate ferredoxin oxidoreductase beta subunit